MDVLARKKISFAQNQEDLLLDRALGKPNGFYVDVGANDPEIDSVTKLFYDRGWRGINIEPNPVPFRRLAARRPRDINLNVGASNTAGELTFYTVPEGDGWSTFNQVFANG
jgi:FkbM family methyltransferase